MQQGQVDFQICVYLYFSTSAENKKKQSPGSSMHIACIDFSAKRNERCPHLQKPAN